MCIQYHQIRAFILEQDEKNELLLILLFFFPVKTFSGREKEEDVALET